MGKSYDYYVVTRASDGSKVAVVPVNGDRKTVRSRLLKKYPATKGFGVSYVSSNTPLDDPYRYAKSFDAFS